MKVAAQEVATAVVTIIWKTAEVSQVLAKVAKTRTRVTVEAVAAAPEAEMRGDLQDTITEGVTSGEEVAPEALQEETDTEAEGQTAVTTTREEVAWEAETTVATEVPTSMAPWITSRLSLIRCRPWIEMRLKQDTTSIRPSTKKDKLRSSTNSTLKTSGSRKDTIPRCFTSGFLKRRVNHRALLRSSLSIS